MFFRLSLFLILVALSIRIHAGPPEEAGAGFSYNLPDPSFVTIVIEKEDGTRVRNLIACSKREAGNNSEHWDGFDDVGMPAPTGKYRWRGIRHDEISSHFQNAFNSPGNPPWNAQDIPSGWNMRAAGSGGWLSDHGAPLCVYAADGKIFIGTNIAEAGNSLMELDLDGVKKWGTLWFSASGANAVATDGGVIYIAGEKGWIGDKLKVHRLSAETHKFVPNPQEWWQVKRFDAAFVDEVSKNFFGIRGMAITPDYIVLSLSDKGRLALFNKKTADFVKDIPLPEAGGLCKSADGTLFAVSGKSVVKLDFASGTTVPVVSSGLVAPSQVAIDADGNLYVNDAAPSEQCVKVFSAKGKFLRTIGEKGGRQEGKYNPRAMGNPAGLAIDSKGKLWVAENYFLPKRVSVWNKDGVLLKEFIGPPSYGGGGSLDPQNANVAFYSGMVFDLKPWPEQTSLRAVAFLPENHKDLPIDAKNIPSYAMRHGSSLYLVSAPGYGVPTVVYEMKGDHLVPRAALGSSGELKKNWDGVQKEFTTKLIEDKVADNVPFLWSDRNGDGKAEPSEITFMHGAALNKPIWSCRVGEALELQGVVMKGKEVRIIRIPAKTESGILTYDFKDTVETPLSKMVGALASDPQGNYIANFGGGSNQGDRTNMLAGLSKDGSIRWTYPNPYPCNWHNSPRPAIGDIQHTLNIEGFAKVKGFDSAVFQLNGNKGVRYLFTGDGLFVCQLFGDMRICPLLSSAKEAKVGARLDTYSLIDECFSGWFGNAPDGRILQIEGKDSSNVMEVRGLGTLKRLSGGEFTLLKTAAVQDIAKFKIPVKVIFDPVFGIKPHEYSYKFPPEKPIASFCLAATRDSLLLKMQVDSGSSFVNAGEDFKTLFKTGDAIDIRFASDPKLPRERRTPGPGDMRIVVANMNSKPVAVLYKFIVPGTKEEVKSKFASPVGTVSVDDIKILKTARVEVKKEGKGYSATVTIPWKELDFEKSPQGVFRGDVGILVADPEGVRTVARYYYYDQKSQVVSDLPSETMVDPSQWGTFEF
ncbi:MAG: hypothetical protein WC637_09065 [Victivallales bacterium]